MNRPVSLLWLEGMDPQCLTELPSLARFAVQGCDLQLKPLPLVEQKQSAYQLLTGMGPGQFGRFDAVRANNYQVHVNDGLPSGAIDRLLPDSIRQQGLRALSVEIRSRSELASLALQAYDFTLIRVLAANTYSFSALEELVQTWLEHLPVTVQHLVLTDVFMPPAAIPVNVNDFLASAGLLKYDEHLAISWPETLVYGLGSGQLWFNMRGREAQGRVRPGRESRKIAKLLLHELVTNWCHPITGEPIVEKVLPKEEAYGSGEYLFKAPDFTLLYRSGYGPSANAYSLHLDGTSVLPAMQERCKETPYAGSARLLARGSQFPAGISDRASLLDIFPTVLYLLGLSLPERLTGQILPILVSERDNAHIASIDNGDELLSEEEEHAILTRLHELGYLS